MFAPQKLCSCMPGWTLSLELSKCSYFFIPFHTCVELTKSMTSWPECDKEGLRGAVPEMSQELLQRGLFRQVYTMSRWKHFARRLEFPESLQMQGWRTLQAAGMEAWSSLSVDCLSKKYTVPDVHGRYLHTMVPTKINPSVSLAEYIPNHIRYTLHTFRWFGADLGSTPWGDQSPLKASETLVVGMG